jgi:hypothetical protein
MRHRAPTLWAITQTAPKPTSKNLGRDADRLAVVHDLQPAVVRQGLPGLGEREPGPHASTLDHEAEREPGEPGEPRREADGPVRVPETP